MLDQMQSIYRLELCGCNEVTEAGLWAALNPKISCLTISDCINIADESLAAIAQLLPSLTEFNLQVRKPTCQSAITVISGTAAPSYQFGTLGAGSRHGQSDRWLPGAPTSE